jgi:hypothetical protein
MLHASLTGRACWLAIFMLGGHSGFRPIRNAWSSAACRLPSLSQQFRRGLWDTFGRMPDDDR